MKEKKIFFFWNNIKEIYYNGIKNSYDFIIIDDFKFQNFNDFKSMVEKLKKKGIIILHLIFIIKMNFWNGLKKFKEYFKK